MADYSGYGVTLEYDLAGGTSWSTLVQVREITPPGISRTSIEHTAHDSTTAWKEFLKGLKDGGEITFMVSYDPVAGSHDFSTGILSDLDDDTTIPNWRLTFPDTGTTQWTFRGFVTSATPATPIDDNMTCSFTVKVALKPTLA